MPNRKQKPENKNESGNAAKLPVSGSAKPKLKKGLITKECGCCWGGGKVEIDDYGNEVDCWVCGGSGRIKI